MRVLILGAGAVGGYMGAKLLAAGAGVVFLARGPRFQALSEQGLVIESPLGNFSGAVKAVCVAPTEGSFDLVIVACKAPSLLNAIGAIAPSVGAQTRILTVLNGVAHLQTLDRAFPNNPILGGVAHGALALRESGTIAHMTPFFSTTFGAVSHQPDPVAEELARLLSEVSVDVRVSPNIQQDMWNKFVFLAAFAGITCLMRASVGTIVATDDGQDLVVQMLNETLSVARAEGYGPDTTSMTSYMKLLTERNSTFTSSMLRDIWAGQQTEAEHIVGDMLRRARAHALETPLLKIANAHLQCYEAGVREASAR